MSEPPEKTVRKRKPTWRAALEAAQKAGKAVKSAVVEDGKVTLVLGEPTADNTETNPWDTVLSDAQNQKRSS
jgi:hypothetical protein